MSLLTLFKRSVNNKYDVDGFVEERLSLLKPSNTSLVDALSYNSDSNDTPIEPQLSGSDVDIQESIVNERKDALLTNTTINSDVKYNETVNIPTLIRYGYQQIKLIRKSTQGRVIQAKSIQNDSNETFVIKIVDKKLYRNKTSKQHHDGTRIVVEKDILKESLLLHHTTIVNTPPAQYMCKFIRFFQDSKYYYLVLENGGQQTLKQWTDKAFKYIEYGQLSLKCWRKIIKYIFWQISVLIFWLHNDMNMCYGGDIMDNLLIRNGQFKINENDGMIEFNPEISIKLCDLSVAEIFKKDTKCRKQCFVSHSQHSSPQLFNGEIYDAQKADIWQLGVCLYRLTFNDYPFQLQNSKIDAGFMSIKNNKLDRFIYVNNLRKYANPVLLSLISAGLLCYDQNKRYDALQILQSQWFKSYWNQYKVRIHKKSLSQKRKLNTDIQQQSMLNFPFYHL